MVLPWETYMISRYCVYVSRRQIARGALQNFAPNGELVLIIADFITYSTTIHICIAAWMEILFVLYLNVWGEATRSWRYWNECRNHELELENKRLYIELTLREAETMPQPPNSVVSSSDQVYDEQLGMYIIKKDDDKVATHSIWFTEAD